MCTVRSKDSLTRLALLCSGLVWSGLDRHFFFLFFFIQRQRNVELFIFESDSTFSAPPTRGKKQRCQKKKEKKEDGSKDEKKYMGVQKTKTGGFQAKISINNQPKCLGTFDTAKKAARAYNRAAMQARRPLTKLNFQDKVPMIYKPKMKKLKPNDTTGYRGVMKNGNRFRASISIGGRLHLGTNCLVPLTRQRRLPLRTISLPFKQTVQNPI